MTKKSEEAKTEKGENGKSLNQSEILNVLLIGLLAGFAGGFLIRSYDPQPDLPIKNVEQKYTTSFEDNKTDGDDEGKWSLIPSEEKEDSYIQGFEYKKDW